MADRRYKLSEKDIQEIRRSYEAEENTQVQLAKRFGVSQAHINEVVNYRSRNKAMQDAGFIKASEKK